MPNAQTTAVDAPRKARKFLLLGNTGAGKTTQLLTLPGKTFAYLFDPNALLSLEGYDIDYEEFLPDQLDMKLISLSKNIGAAGSTRGAEVYNAWELDFEKKIRSRFFDRYDNIAFDSFTTFSDMVMDGVLAINGRGGLWPQQDDYAPQMLTIAKVTRVLTAMGKTIVMTGHVETYEDKGASRLIYAPMMTGRLKQKLPLLFSEILFLKAKPGREGNTVYIAQTKVDNMMPTIRCTMKGLDLKREEDITIDFSRPVKGQGIGGWLERAGKSAPEETQATK